MYVAVLVKVGVFVAVDVGGALVLVGLGMVGEGGK